MKNEKRESKTPTLYRSVNTPVFLEVDNIKHAHRFQKCDLEFLVHDCFVLFVRVAFGAFSNRSIDGDCVHDTNKSYGTVLALRDCFVPTNIKSYIK